MEEKPSKASRGQGRVAFLALADTFRKLLDEGHPLISIYSDHKQQLGIGYPHFTKYVQRYIRKDSNEHQKESSQSATITTVVKQTENPVKAADKSKPSTDRRPGDKIRGFRHDPNSGNTRTDLI